MNDLLTQALLNQQYLYCTRMARTQDDPFDAIKWDMIAFNYSPHISIFETNPITDDELNAMHDALDVDCQCGEEIHGF